MNWKKKVIDSLLRIDNKYYKALLFVLAILFALSCAKSGRDFEVFVNAGWKIINNKDIYQPPLVRGLDYFYSPLFALILAPFSKLPVIVPQFLWVLLSYFFLYRTWFLCLKYFDYSKFSKKQYNTWLFIVLILSVRFLRDDLAQVQMTIFLLWATLESMGLFNRGRNITGAALLALAINIKLLPLVFIIYLFYRSKFKAALLTCGFFILYLYIPALYLGWERNNFLLHEWLGVINPLNKGWTIESDNGPSSLVALIPVYLTNTVGSLPYKRNFFNLNYQDVFLIVNLFRLVFLFFTLIFLHTLPFRGVNNKIRQFWEMCYLFILIPLIFPHQQQYAFVYIIPVFIYITCYFIANWTKIQGRLNYWGWIVIALIGVNFSPIIGSDIITWFLYGLLLYYRVLTIAVILLIPILWIIRPKDTNNKLIG